MIVVGNSRFRCISSFKGLPTVAVFFIVHRVVVDADTMAISAGTGTWHLVIVALLSLCMWPLLVARGVLGQSSA